ncbi:phage portal protein [Mesorhizobium sp. IMUNJ 23232]|uniref:phage portal protein n=1 Tax=Mesorhizobium sp. IMUNJ 23232 TaxID=3376064 RepID=UPI0037912921
MSIWTKIFGNSQPVEAKDIGLASPELLTLFGGLPTSSGIVIGEASAAREPTAGSAIRLLAGVLATTKVHLYQRGEDGERARADSHPAEKLVANFSNSWTPAPDLRRAMMCEAVNHGVAYALVSKVRGSPRELIQLPRSAVTRTTDDATGEPSFSVSLKGGGTRRYAFSDILEIRPWGGRSLTGDGADAIARALTLADHAAKLFRNGAKPSGILKIPGRLNELAAKRISDAWTSSFGGENSGRTAVIEEGGSFEQITMSAVDAEYSASMTAAQEDVARCYGVPLTLLNHLEHATWKNPEQLALQFLQYSMLPVFESWQGALARCLLTPEERENYFFEFDLNGFAKADLATRAAAYSTLITARVLNPNEVRAKENMPGYGPAGDEYANPAISPGPAGSASEAADDGE